MIYTKFHIINMISYINSLEGAEYSRLLKIHNDFKKYNIEELLPDKIDIINELETDIFQQSKQIMVDISNMITLLITYLVTNMR